MGLASHWSLPACRGFPSLPCWIPPPGVTNSARTWETQEVTWLVVSNHGNLCSIININGMWSETHWLIIFRGQSLIKNKMHVIFHLYGYILLVVISHFIIFDGYMWLSSIYSKKTKGLVSTHARLGMNNKNQILRWKGTHPRIWRQTQIQSVGYILQTPKNMNYRYINYVFQHILVEIYRPLSPTMYSIGSRSSVDMP